MANILGLALKVTGDASGLAKSLTPVDRALDNLAKQADRATAVFKPLTDASAGAARAQEQFAERFARLADQLQEDTIKPQEYAAAFAQLTEEAKRSAEAFAEGIRIQRQYGDQTKVVADEIERLVELERLGAIDQTALNNAAIARLGIDKQAAQSARERADAVAAAERQQTEAIQAAEKLRADLSNRAARVLEANLSAQERAQNRYNAEVAEYETLLRARLLTIDDYNKAVERSARAFAKATVEANKTSAAAESIGKGTLKFNELSGILSALPGPLGSVAGRLSGLASASEGLTRVFSGGLTPGLASIGTSLASVVNPATLAAAGIAGIGAAAAAVVSGLSSLEAETERLQNAADKLGVSFGFMQTLQKAAEMSGVSFETVNGAMTKLLKTLAGADEESKQATAALGRLGVSLGDLEGLDSEQQLKLIGERLQGIEDPAKRAAAATAIFGKSGAELLPFFNNLGTAEQTLNRFNARLSEIDVGRVLALGDSFDAVKASLSGVGNELLTPFIGITQSLSDGLASAIATFGRNIGAVLDIFSPLTSAIGLAGNVLLQFGSTLGNLIGTVLEPFAAQGRLISGVIDAMSQAVTAVAGRINDAIVGFREFFKFEGVAASFRDTFAQIGEVVSRVAAIAEAAFARLGSVIGDTLGRAATVVGESVSQFLEFTGLGSVVSGFAETVGAAFGGLWDAIKSIVGQVGGFIERVLQFAEEWLGIVPEIEQPVVATVEVNGGGAIEELVAESKTFQKTLDDVTKGVNDAINESAKFGQAGFDAALKYQTAVDNLKKKLDAGLFNEETFRREAEKAGAAFKTELARLEEDAKLDIQINAEAEKTLAGLQEKINKAVEGSQQFGQAGFDAAARFQGKLRDLGAQFEDGRINAATLAQEVAKATSEYDKQIEGFKKIDELQKRTLENEKNRVAELLKAGDTTTQLERDIEVVDRERLRLEEEIRKQREAGNVIAADAATAKLAQLDQLQAKLDDQQQAVEQGFADGFTKAFEATNKSIDGLIEKAEQFGNVGALAAQALEQGIALAQEQARDGILTAETYQKEVERQQELFNQRLAAAQRVEDFLAAQLNDRQKAELEAVKQLEERKKQAAVNVQAIEAKILTERKAIEDARKNGNLAEARAGVNRLNQLNQAKRAEQQIANGRANAEQQQLRQFQQGGTVTQQFQNLVTQQNDLFLSGIQNAYAGANAALAQSARVAQEQAERVRRFEELSRPTNQLAQTADFRTAEGQALVLETAAQAQDPALIEARLQTKQLNLIAKGITQAAANYFNSPVAIVGGAVMG